jgi:hypothetical protein
VSERFARRAWATVAGTVTEVDFGDRTAYILAEDVEALTSAVRPRGRRLLPPYEPYLQQRDRTAAVPDTALHKRIWKGHRQSRRGAARRRSGRAVAVAEEGRRLLIRVEPVAALSERDRGRIDAEAAPLAEFRGCAVTDVGYA